MANVIDFKLDGEPEKTTDHELAPNFIIKEFGKKDPTTNYLIQLKNNGQEKTSYEGKGEIPIKIHENMNFQIISTGPTPVSDTVKSPLESFLEGLTALGYSPTIIDVEKRRIAFEYLVQTGKYSGKTYTQGFEVPQDFPLTPPSGPHVKAILHQTGLSGSHPYANVHNSDFGNDWQYWSRPFPDWPKSKQTVGAYLSHIFQLWDTQ